MTSSNQINAKVIAKAEEFSKHFTKIVHQETKREFYVLDDTAPSTLKDMVRAAHGDFFPDDFRYEVIYSALLALAECRPDDDLEEVRVEVDIYSHELIQWLGSNLKRITYCDEAQSEFGLEMADVMNLITYGQQREKDEIVDLVREALISLCT